MTGYCCCWWYWTPNAWISFQTLKENRFWKIFDIPITNWYAFFPQESNMQKIVWHRALEMHGWEEERGNSLSLQFVSPICLFWREYYNFFPWCHRFCCKSFFSFPCVQQQPRSRVAKKSQNNLDGSIYSLKTGHKHWLLVWLGSQALAQRVHQIV